MQLSTADWEALSLSKREMQVSGKRSNVLDVLLHAISIWNAQSVSLAGFSYYFLVPTVNQCSHGITLKNPGGFSPQY